MSKVTTYQINFRGGILSPGVLRDIMAIAASLFIRQVRFGLRQQLLLEVPVSSTRAFEEACTSKGIACAPFRGAPPNITSSYPAAGICNTDGWVREGVYKDIFNQFQHTPQIKINICDSTQQLVPFFTGHINWISAAAAHYWHVYIRFPKTQMLYRWPEQVYTNDIGRVSQQIETCLQQHQERYKAAPEAAGAHLFTTIKEMGIYTGRDAGTPLHIQRFALPYYEGFNKGDSGLWLGLYRRDEAFPVAFLQDLCAVCMDCKIGELYTTPWKSLVIKGIQPADTIRFDWVLGKYRINVRHAANELNWQVEDGDDGGLQVKRHLIRHFDKEDVRTFGLSFGVQSRPTSSMFGSIIIRKQQNRNPHKLKSLERFDLLHTRDFNPNSSDLVLFREALEKDHLGTYLVSLCKLFYEQQEVQLSQTAPNPTTMVLLAKAETRQLYQCPECFTVYDEQLGDPEQQVKAGTPFNALPDGYCCPTCDSSKAGFVAIDSMALQLKVA